MAAVGAFISGLALWWFIRARLDRVWLPLVAILPKRRKELPKLIAQRPPWPPFLIFALLALLWLAYFTRPLWVSPAPGEAGRDHAIVLVDLSPSVSAHVSLKDLATRVADLWSAEQKIYTLSLSTTSELSPTNPADGAAAAEHILGLGWHRPGANLADAAAAHLRGHPDTKRLLIVSDQDRFSWNSFQWQALATDMVVQWIDVTKADRSDNVFFEQVSVMSLEGARDGVDIRLGMSADHRAQHGQIRAEGYGKVLASNAWDMSPSTNSLSVPLTWDRVITPGGGDADKEITLTITSDPAGGGDAITIDNEWTVTMRRGLGPTLVVSEPSSEMQLVDRSGQVIAALSSLGVAWQRMDFWPQTQKGQEDNVSKDSLSIASGSFDPERWSRIITFASADLLQTRMCRDMGESHVEWWLSPHRAENASELCRCIGQWVGDDRRWPATLCADKDSSQSSGAWLQALGQRASQTLRLGDQVIGWTFVHDKGASGGTLLVLADPLWPQPGLVNQRDLGYGSFPLLVQSLIQSVSASDGKSPSAIVAKSIQSMTQILESLSGGAGTKDSKSVSDQAQMLLLSSPVPVGESRLMSMDQKEMPPRYGSMLARADVAMRQGDETKSKPIVPWLVLLSVLTILGEWLYERRLRRGSIAAQDAIQVSKPVRSL